MKTIHDFSRKKMAHEKITMITCYDYTSAKILEQTHIDCVLVGDTVAMLMHGYPNTTHATVAMMSFHTKAVARGLNNKFIIADLPFMSYRQSQQDTMHAVQTLMQAGASAVKLEGAEGNLNTIQYIVESGIPVMGHMGLTPQHIHGLGGLKLQGKNDYAKKQLLQQAKQLQQAGCFAIVLECVPTELAKNISENLTIPTIGIGAGPHTDGQVLVFQDLLGLQTQFKPKFLKQYLKGEELFVASINDYVNEVNTVTYPSVEYAYEG